MSMVYGASQRRLQEENDTRRLADRLADLAHAEIPPEERAFIESRTMFFLATVDETGQPTVSYKGGPSGFLRVTDDSHVVFPNYDGNGMYLSLGNIVGQERVGMLFIDFESPRRLRLHGRARLDADDPMRSAFPGARSIVRVEPEVLFVNCGRYIHQVDGMRLSPHTPAAGREQPFPNWKRIDIFAGTLPAGDDARVAEAGGRIAIADYAGEHDPPP